MSDGKQQKGQRQQAARRCKKASDGKQLAADAFTAAPLQKVLSADIGLYTGAVVTDDGQLYAYGYGGFGGHGLGIRDVAVPTRVRGGLENERVVLVRIGNIFSTVLTASTRPRSWCTKRIPASWAATALPMVKSWPRMVTTKLESGW